MSAKLNRGFFWIALLLIPGLFPVAHGKTPGEGSKSCRSGQFEALDLNFQSSHVRESPSDLGLRESRLGTIRSVGSTAIFGNCADEIVGVLHSQILLRDGRIFDYLSKTGVDGQLLVESMSLTRRDRHPLGVPGVFVMATRLRGGKNAGGFVGIWRKGAVSSLYYFERRGDGSFSKPESVLTSDLPVKSVTSGMPLHKEISSQLLLTQSVMPGRIRVLNLMWSPP